MTARPGPPALLSLTLLAGCPIPEPSRPLAPPEIRVFGVEPFAVAPGEPATARWAVAGALERLELRRPSAPPTALEAPEGRLELRPTTTTPLALWAEGPGGRALARAEVRVGAPRPVAVDAFSVTPTLTRAGDPVRVAWVARDAARVRLLGGAATLADDLPAAGARVVRLEASTRLVLRAEGLGGPVDRAARVEVGRPPPILVELVADPPEVEAGRVSTLRWTVARAERFTLFEETPDGATRTLRSGPAPDGAGRFIVQAPPGLHRFLLEVTAGAETRRARVTLRVRAPPRARIAAFTLTPTVTGPGGETRADWRVRDASQVSLWVEDEAPEPVRAVGSRRLVAEGPRRVRLRAAGAGGSVREERRLGVDPGRPRIVAFAASPSRTAPGEPVRVTWAVERARRVRVEGELGSLLLDGLPARGAGTLRPDGPTEVRLVAENAAGVTTRGLRLRVGPRPVVERFEILEPRYREGRPLRFAFAVRNAVQAVLTRPGRSPRALEIPTGTVTLRRGASGPDRPDGWLEAASELFVVTASASRPRLPRARGVDEVEPNDTPALAHELSAPPSSFEGTLAPGDVDVLALDGLAPRRLRLTARCATADLALVARGADAEGAPLGAVARVAPLPCGRPVEAALAALPGDLLLRVEGSPRVEQSYRLELDAVVPRCGDGVVDRDEACDDGNPVSGDGCDRRCQIEGLDELEPNAVRPNASRLRPGVQSGFLGLSDTDWYRLVVAPGSGGPWRFAIEDARGGCDLDARLALVDARGRRLGEAGEDGLGCPRLDAPVSVLGPGTWYLRVAAGRGRHLSPRGLYRLIATPPP